MKVRKQIVLSIRLLLCVSIASSQEITSNGIVVGPHSFSTFLERQNKTLIAKGTSYLTYFRLAICSAVLYLEPHASNHIVTSVHNSTSNESSSIALEISYHKSVRASDFRWATTHYTKKNGWHDSDSVKELIDEFNLLYRDVRRDDRYLLEYHSEGVALSLNGDFLGNVGAGSPYEKELAQAIYSIWFGQYPFFERLKRDLLSPISL
ncbi:hypothetical protein ACHAWO_009266 [Cyclotella atomus]|uniref:Chalcone isomerase domain-containing protein n=1 Tax=Cyclotella atomus TaxID=382360 RepID=A0ABD3Q4Q7_9STRA